MEGAGHGPLSGLRWGFRAETNTHTFGLTRVKRARAASKRANPSRATRHLLETGSQPKGGCGAMSSPIGPNVLAPADAPAHALETVYRPGSTGRSDPCPTDRRHTDEGQVAEESRATRHSLALNAQAVPRLALNGRRSRHVLVLDAQAVCRLAAMNAEALYVERAITALTCRPSQTRTRARWLTLYPMSRRGASALRSPARRRARMPLKARAPAGPYARHVPSRSSTLSPKIHR